MSIQDQLNHLSKASVASENRGAKKIDICLPNKRTYKDGFGRCSFANFMPDIEGDYTQTLNGTILFVLTEALRDIPLESEIYVHYLDKTFQVVSHTARTEHSLTLQVSDKSRVNLGHIRMKTE